jgi:uncharacterized Zn finger protein
MPVVACPACGEDEDLTGRRTAGDNGADRLVVRCGTCGRSWDRDTTVRCGLCGADDVEGVPTSTLQERGRGDQWAPSGIRLVYYCWSCGGDDVTSSQPRPGPNPPPGGSNDLRAFRGLGG